MRTYHLHVLSNVSRMLYVGVTGDLHRRLFEHKNKLVPGYSRNYNLHKLVYIEAYGNINDAISREKEIKGWLRSKKADLIKSANPWWNDLAANYFSPLTTRPPTKKTCRPEATRRG
jgi:putative endonuclease